MYVCVCRALTDRDVRAAAAAGANRPADVFRAHGTRPQCGRCLDCMREELDEARVANGAANAPLPPRGTNATPLLAAE